MAVKIKESFEKTRQVKNNDKSEKHILRGQRNARYYEKIFSNKKNLIISSIFSLVKNVTGRGLKISTYTNISTGYPMIYHTLL